MQYRMVYAITVEDTSWEVRVSYDEGAIVRVEYLEVLQPGATLFPNTLITVSPSKEGPVVTIGRIMMRDHVQIRFAVLSAILADYSRRVEAA